MTTQFKSMLRSWTNVFIASVITALIVVLGDGALTWNDLWYVLIAGAVAVLPVIKNYFDPNYSLYGKGDTTVEVVVPE